MKVKTKRLICEYIIAITSCTGLRLIKALETGSLIWAIVLFINTAIWAFAMHKAGWLR